MDEAAQPRQVAAIDKLVRHQQDLESALDDRRVTDQQQASEMRGELLGRRGLFKFVHEGLRGNGQASMVGETERLIPV